MNANLPDADMAVLGETDAGLTAGVQPAVQHPGRQSPASAVCHLEAQDPSATETAPAHSAHSADDAHAASEQFQVGTPGPRAGDESDTTPRPDLPSEENDEAAAATAQQHRRTAVEPAYFSPQPLRFYGSHLPASAPVSSESSPSTSVNASTTSVDAPVLPSTDASEKHSTTGLSQSRPGVQRDYSSASTASASTIRPPSVDPLQTFTPANIQGDGPHYPNQSYAALHSQIYPITHHPSISRSRTSQPSHYPSLSAAHIGTFSHPDHHREIIETGSKTVGNSPASSPGLFSPTTPPLRHMPQSDDGYYSSPWLHHTHRQAPKETHVADVDVDPISGRKIVNQYEIVDELGRGVHGKVKLGRNLDTGGTVAIKIVDRYSKRRRLGKSTSHEDKIKKEIAILKKARHENIVSLIEVIDDPSRKKVYIILEHVELGEVKWRTEGEPEVALVEWRRFQRESQGIVDNDNALVQDQKILTMAHQKLQREERRRLKLMHLRRHDDTTSEEAWSLEFGGESEDDLSSSGPRSRASTLSNGQALFQQRAGRREARSYQESNMETAIRSPTPSTLTKRDEPDVSAELEGTMYGAYDTDLWRGRTPSITGSTSSTLTDEYDEIPENFRYVPLLTIQAARETFRDTVLGLEYLHYQNVVHRDIKPANLLQTKEHRIKISDFGVSYLGRPRREDSTGDQSESDMQDIDEAIELAKTVGTPAFYAPELCRTDVDAELYPVSQQIDVWALGVTLYCLIYGRVPFHDHNTFHLMRLIADTDVYIPKTRLRAVAEQNGSRPSSHGRMYPNMTAFKRAPHDSTYEEVDDLLQDLLRRLLTKDPRRRISIKEIKHHPWLLQGIDNPDAWMLQTDPSRSLTKKIEISKDDVEQAVVPLTLIERVRSGVRKTIDIFTNRRTTSRRRAQSSVAGPEHLPSNSANSSSSTISQEGRRPSLAMNQSIFEALSRSRDPEHPLSQSVTVTPEAHERSRFFDMSNSRTASPAHSVESNEHLAPLAGPTRPPPPERAHSTMSTAGSIRTIRQTDLSRSGRPMSPLIPPALPGTPLALESPGGSNLGGVFGGMPRHVVTNARSRELLLRPSRDALRGKFIDRPASTDPEHSGPSVALSTAIAIGHVDQPDILKDMSPTSARGPSPSLYGYPPDPLERASSRQSSISSASSHVSRNYAGRNQLEVGPPLPTGTHSSHHFREPSGERYARAKDEFMRRRVIEEKQSRDRPQSMNFPRPTSASSQQDCPPSPDDDMFYESQIRKVEKYLNGDQNLAHGSGPVEFNEKSNLASSSSEEFTWMSQSTSNPSIPSVVSANSSIVPEDFARAQPPFPSVATAPSAESFNQFDRPTDDPAGYDGDDALESDDDDSDEDDFIMMGRKKPAPPRRSGSISNAELARANVKKEYLAGSGSGSATGLGRRRSARSGSNGTVKKVVMPVDEQHDHTHA